MVAPLARRTPAVERHRVVLAAEGVSLPARRASDAESCPSSIPPGSRRAQTAAFTADFANVDAESGRERRSASRLGGEVPREPYQPEVKATERSLREAFAGAPSKVAA